MYELETEGAVSTWRAAQLERLNNDTCSHNDSRTDDEDEAPQANLLSVAGLFIVLGLVGAAAVMVSTLDSPRKLKDTTRKLQDISEKSKAATAIALEEGSSKARCLARLAGLQRRTSSRRNEGGGDEDGTYASEALEGGSWSRRNEGNGGEDVGEGGGEDGDKDGGEGGGSDSGGSESRGGNDVRF